MLNLPKMKRITFLHRDYYYSISFDVNDFLGDGTFYLQLFDGNKRLIYDKPYANSQYHLVSAAVRHDVLRELHWILGE
jgi:hypothetical protein